MDSTEIGWKKDIIKPEKLDDGSKNDTSKKMKKKKHYKSLSESSDSSDSSSSSSSSSGGDRRKRRKEKKEKRREEKRLKKQKKAIEKIQKREFKKLMKEKRREEKRLKKSGIVAQSKTETTAQKEDEHELKMDEDEDFSIPLDLMYTKTYAPESKNEYDERQSQIRRVVDPETGRTRLIKGDGEILEEIVTKDRHKEINKQATKADGEFFHSKTVGWNIPK